MKERSFGGRPGGSGRNFGPKEDRLRINHEIRAPQIRLIDDEGKMLGVYSPADALRMAQDKGLDLIEIAPTASPPTCKIMDYGKWKYENKKKAQVSKKKQAVITVKELQVRPRTDQHDLDVKLRQAKNFLLEGAKVKFNMRFSGREMAHQDIGVQVLEKVIAALTELCALEQPPKKEGRQMHLILGPDPVKIKEYRKKHPELAKAVPQNEDNEDSGDSDASEDEE